MGWHLQTGATQGLATSATCQRVRHCIVDASMTAGSGRPQRLLFVMSVWTLEITTEHSLVVLKKSTLLLQWQVLDGWWMQQHSCQGRIGEWCCADGQGHTTWLVMIWECTDWAACRGAAGDLLGCIVCMAIWDALRAGGRDLCVLMWHLHQGVAGC